MRRFLVSARSWFNAFGCDPYTFLFAVRGLPPFFSQYFLLRRQMKRSGTTWKTYLNRPCLHDRFALNGPPGGHYFHQDLLVATRIFRRGPAKHVDVGSSISGFVSHVATFRPIEVLDIRSTPSLHPNIVFRQCDLMNPPADLLDYCDSLSCLHALEHFGLGRYGDRLDANGHFAGFGTLTRMLKGGGVLYLSVPIGAERIEFNGHRVFGINTVLAMAENEFDLVGFSYVDDFGNLHENVPLSSIERSHNFGLYYGCGIFELSKRYASIT